MKVFVTGTKGKLVTYFREYVQKNKKEWKFDFVTLRNDKWKTMDLSVYDSVIHIAGITSAPDDDYEEYRKVNVDLTRALFEKTVHHKVRQFVYLSSMAVYDGIDLKSDGKGLITEKTKPIQKTNYGKSKFEAEEAINIVLPNNTKIAIVRTSSIVGGGAPSCFKRYVQFSKIPIVPIPYVTAKRSFVYIDTLIEFICNLLEHISEGIYFPQSLPQLSVAEIMYEVCRACGAKKEYWGEKRNWVLQTMEDRFSQMHYDEALSFEQNMSVGCITSQEAIKRTVMGNRTVSGAE